MVIESASQTESPWFRTNVMTDRFLATRGVGPFVQILLISCRKKRPTETIAASITYDCAEIVPTRPRSRFAHAVSEGVQRNVPSTRRHERRCPHHLARGHGRRSNSAAHRESHQRVARGGRRRESGRHHYRVSASRNPLLPRDQTDADPRRDDKGRSDGHLEHDSVGRRRPDGGPSDTPTAGRRLSSAPAR